MSIQTLQNPDIFAQRRAELSELAQLAKDDQDKADLDAMRKEIELAELVQAEANKYTQRQKELGRTLLRSSVEEMSQQAKKQEITKTTIGWLSEKKVDVPLERKLSPNGKPFLYGRLTEFSNRTKVDEQIFPEPVLSGIEETIVRHVGNKIDATDRRTRDLRPLGPSATRDHTDLNPYKDDNVSINNDDGIRALILEDGSNRDEPIYYLASVCKHDNQQRLIYDL